MCWFFYNTDGLLAEDCLGLYRKGSAAVKVVSVTQWAQVLASTKPKSGTNYKVGIFDM
jgi:hypothetical protein